MRGSADAYGTVARLFHWSTALLLSITFLLALVLATMDQMRPRVLPWHRSIGLFVLFVTILRLMWRTFDQHPAQQSNLVFGRAATGLHRTLYLGLVIVPLFGWLFTNARGRSVSVIGWVLPKLMVKDEYYARLTIAAHEYLAFGLLALAVLHIAAAGWHRFVLGDNTGSRMGLSLFRKDLV